MTNLIFHPATKRIGRLICATSPTAWGAPRIIVEWDDGTESKVCDDEIFIVDTQDSACGEC